MNNAVSLSHLVLGLRPDKDGGKFSVTEACSCVERVAGTEPVSLAGVCTEAEELQVLAPDAPAGSQNEYQGQGQPAVPANAEHSELIFDHVSLAFCL